MPCGCFGKKKKGDEVAVLEKGNDKVSVKSEGGGGGGSPSNKAAEARLRPAEDDPDKATRRRDVVASYYSDQCELLGYKPKGSRPSSTHIGESTPLLASPDSPTLRAASSPAASLATPSPAASSPASTRSGASCRAELAEKRREFFKQLANDERSPLSSRTTPSFTSTLPSAGRSRHNNNLAARPTSHPSTSSSGTTANDNFNRSLAIFTKIDSGVKTLPLPNTNVSETIVRRENIDNSYIDYDKTLQINTEFAPNKIEPHSSISSSPTASLPASPGTSSPASPETASPMSPGSPTVPLSSSSHISPVILDMSIMKEKTTRDSSLEYFNEYESSTMNTEINKCEDTIPQLLKSEEIYLSSPTISDEFKPSAPPEYVEEFISSSPQVELPRFTPPPPHYVEEERRSSPPPPPPQYVEEERRPSPPSPPQYVEEERRPLPPPPPQYVEKRRSSTPPPQYIAERKPSPPPQYVEERRPSPPPQYVEEKHTPLPQTQFVEERKPSPPPEYIEKVIAPTSQHSVEEVSVLLNEGKLASSLSPFEGPLPSPPPTPPELRQSILQESPESPLQTSSPQDQFTDLTSSPHKSEIAPTIVQSQPKYPFQFNILEEDILVPVPSFSSKDVLFQASTSPPTDQSLPNIQSTQISDDWFKSTPFDEISEDMLTNSSINEEFEQTFGGKQFTLSNFQEGIISGDIDLSSLDDATLDDMVINFMPSPTSQELPLIPEETEPPPSSHSSQDRLQSYEQTNHAADQSNIIQIDSHKDNNIVIISTTPQITTTSTTITNTTIVCDPSRQDDIDDGLGSEMDDLLIPLEGYTEEGKASGSQRS